jgi:hypothetical protein
MFKTGEGSTGRLLQLCVGYFTFYVMTGVAVKYFLGEAGDGFPGMNGIQYLVYSTLGSAGVVLGIVLALRWYRMDSHRLVTWGPLRFPSEYLYIVPSGICTAIVIPTTTLMYTLPIAVMVAMVIMRGAIIVVSRIVDAVQIRLGLLQKTVYREENIAVVFALLAVGAKIVWTPSIVNPLADALQRLGLEVAASLRLDVSAPGNFEFLRSRAAMGILGSYIIAYAIRIYIMNFYKNTRARGEPLNNKAFFSVEQLSASVTLVMVLLLLLALPQHFGGQATQIGQFQEAFASAHPQWKWAAVSGIPFGVLAFFSVFIFMFKGRTATFAGLVNRLTSLIAGTTATLLFHYLFGGRFPEFADWLALLFILVAVAFLTQAERKRRVELVAAQEERVSVGGVPESAPTRASA